MKRSAKVMAFVLACAVTPVIVPQASAQTQPANPGDATGCYADPATDPAGPATEADPATKEQPGYG